MFQIIVLTYLSKELKKFVDDFIPVHQSQIVSILHTTHPFAGEEVLIVCRDDVSFVPDLLSEAYHYVPFDITLNCLRMSELFELSFPGAFTPTLIIEYPHPTYLLKYKSSVLYGSDIRDNIKLPENPVMLLKAYIQGCKLYVRGHIILFKLAKGEYIELILELDKQIQYLMATALLLYNELDICTDTLFDRFQYFFPDEAIITVLRDFALLIKKINGMDVEISRDSAFEATWLFESFLKCLREYTK